jgi:hypothetical protein
MSFQNALWPGSSEDPAASAPTTGRPAIALAARRSSSKVLRLYCKVLGMIRAPMSFQIAL